jgi:hypothetical protein
MAGPKVRIRYVDDGGNFLRTAPTWAHAVTGDTAADGTELPWPKGKIPRYRFIKDNTTGREHKFVVGDVTSAAWTSAFGATVTGLTAIPGSATTTFSYAGRTRGRDLIRI